VTILRATRAAVAVALALSGAASIAACSDSATPAALDMPQAEQSIAAYVQKTYPDFSPGHLDCPASVAVAAGGQFDCTVPFGDDTLDIRVTIENADGSEISYKPQEAVLDMTRVRDGVHSEVAGQFTGDVTVDCGFVLVRVVAPGSGFDCTATDALGTARTVHVTISDVNGNFTTALA
jgi:Domain of unknown function (DUF4333)